MEKTFEQQLLDRLDKIIELLEKDKKSKKRLLEDTAVPTSNREWFTVGNYPKDAYGGDTFYCGVTNRIDSIVAKDKEEQ